MGHLLSMGMKMQNAVVPTTTTTTTFPSSNYSYSGTYLPWPSSTTGYTVYSGGWYGIDDSYTIDPIVLSTTFYMDGTGSSNLYVSTNGFVTLDFGDGGIYYTPQDLSSPPMIGGNPGDMWLAAGDYLNNGDTQNAWYQVNTVGSKYNFKLIIYCARYGDPNAPYSYVLNFYRDSNYQWMETMIQINASGGTVGPYNAAGDVSQSSSTASQVWRGDLNGQNWVYQGFGSVV